MSRTLATVNDPRRFGGFGSRPGAWYPLFFITLTMRFSIIFLCLLLTAGCAAPGAPQPPSLGIPKPINDLKAVRKGEAVTLNWTAPTETTDGELVRRAGKIVVMRGLSGGTAPSGWQNISQMELPPALKRDQPTAQDLKDDITAPLQIGADFASYSVVSENSKGRNAGASNQVQVPLVPTLATPAHVNAVPVPTGISVTWDQAWQPQNQSHLTAEYAYRIMRREEGSKSSVVVKEVGVTNQAAAVVDEGIEWQKHYQYWIVPVTSWQGGGKKGEVQGGDSPVVSVFADDIFPPAVPVGLEAVYSATGEQPSIDLSWTPDTEPDLAGYNVYRRTENEPSIKVNSDLVKTSSFRDTAIKAGGKYYYSISAIDVRGNESVRSPEASETVPPQ